MVNAWLMDDTTTDQRLEHHRNPKEFLSLDYVAKTTGIEYFKLDASNYKDDLRKIREERGYTYEDTIEISPEKLPNYEEKIKIFFTEHLHIDEEIRFILAGCGYFDVRGKNEEWIRVLVEVGDLLILPAGIYHRFTLDSTNYIKANRLFVGEPVWTPHNRPSDELPARLSYVQLQKSMTV